MTKDDKIFYSKDFTIILDSLIKYFPYSLAFKLYDIQDKESLTYADLITDGLTNNPHTYKSISDYLVYNDFAKYSIANSDYIVLTDKGRELIKAGAYGKYVEYDNLKRTAEIADLRTKKNYYYIEFVKIIIPFILGLLSTCLFRGCCV